MDLLEKKEASIVGKLVVLVNGSEEWRVLRSAAVALRHGVSALVTPGFQEGMKSFFCVMHFR